MFALDLSETYPPPPPLMEAAAQIIDLLIDAAQKKETRQLATGEAVDWRVQEIIADPVIDRLREEINNLQDQVDQYNKTLEAAGEEGKKLNDKIHELEKVRGHEEQLAALKENLEAAKNEEAKLNNEVNKLEKTIGDKDQALAREKDLGVEMVGIHMPPNIASAGPAYLAALNLLIRHASKQLADTDNQPHIELAFNEEEYIAACVCKGGISKDDSNALPPRHLRDIKAILLHKDPEYEQGLDADELATLRERRKPYQDLSNPARWRRSGTMMQPPSEHTYHIENVTGSSESLAHELASQMANDYEEDKYPGQVKAQWVVNGQALSDKEHDQLANERKRQPTEFIPSNDREILTLKGTAAEHILGALGVDATQIQEPSRGEDGGGWQQAVFKKSSPPQYRQL